MMKYMKAGQRLKDEAGQAIRGDWHLPCGTCVNGPSFCGCMGCYPPEYPKYEMTKAHKRVVRDAERKAAIQDEVDADGRVISDMRGGPA